VQRERILILNNPHTVPTEPDSQCVTPWPRTPSFHPSWLLSGLALWAALPSRKYLAPHFDKADLKTIGDILKRNDEATAIKNANHIGVAGGQLSEALRDGNALGAEKARRALAEMDISSYEKALADLLLIEREAGNFAADWCEKLAEKRWPEFEAIALQAEARLIQYGHPLSEKNVIDGCEIETFQTHSDVCLKGVYVELWHMACGWPAEFRRPRLSPLGTALGWLRDVTA